MWYYNAITGNYNTYEWEDDYQVTEDFKEGYFFNQFNEENLKKVKEIISIISPESVALETDDQKMVAANKLIDMFGNEVESMIYEYTSEQNECKTRGFNQMIKDDFCNPFYNYGIFTKRCLREYFTSVGMLEMSLAKELVPTVVRTLKTNDPNSVLNIDMFLRALRYEIENYKPEDEKSVEDSPKYDIPGMEDVMGGLDKLKIREEEPINESIVGYKNEFERYLKSPKQ
jgi:hypothetical protein